MKVIILAGGGGVRLFPLSRQSYPKQFLHLEDNKSLFAHTVDRFLSLVSATDILIVTNKQYLYQVENELNECNAQAAHILLEPVGRNTAPAIALAKSFCETKLGCLSDEVLIVAASDHVIRPQNSFEKCILNAEKVAAEGYLVTFGIQARRPETGYGYIEVGPSNGCSYAVASFKEKPDLKTAEQYVATGNYYWNSGMFAFQIGVFQHELALYEPSILEVLSGGYEAALEHFAEMPDISIDYALAERSSLVRMVPLTCYWSDIGSWDAMYDFLPKDSNGNACKGDCMALDCRDSLIMGRDRLVAGIGIDDLLLVETDDVIVVAKRGESQKVKNLVEQLKNNGRKEAIEHTTNYYFWGTSFVISSGMNYQIKKIRLLPGCKLSSQIRQSCSEYLIVLKGTAKVLRGKEQMIVYENGSVFIPPRIEYCLDNYGQGSLEILEVQNGSCLEEVDARR